MDFISFLSFNEFLKATEDYARRSGFRFRLSEVPDSATLIVTNTISKVQSGECAQDLVRAHKITEQEGIRNVMISTCKELDLWPPSTPDRLDSIAYTDVSEPLDTIAWALYNYDQNLKESLNYEEQRRTASYLVDFAHAIGQPVEMSKPGSQMLLQFLERAHEWTEAHKYRRGNLRDVILQKLNEFADPLFIQEVETWLDRHGEAVAVGSIALVAGFALAALAFSSRKKS